MTDKPTEPEWHQDHCLTIYDGRVEISNPEEPFEYIDADADDVVHLGDWT